MSAVIFKMKGRMDVHRGGWAITGICIVVLISWFIADAKLPYLVALSAPLLIYLSIARPFVFPFGAYVFLLPFDQLLSLEDLAGGSTLTKLLGVSTILVLLLKGSFEKKLQKPDSVTLLWISLVLYGSLSAAWAIEPQLTLGRLPTAFGLMLLYLVASSYKIQNNEIDTLKLFVLAGGLLASLLTIYNFRSLETAARASVQLGEGQAGLNQLPFDLLLSTSICIERILSGKRMMKVVFCIMLGIILFSVIITGSRGALLGAGTIVIVYVLCTKRKLSLGTILLVVAIALLAATPAFFVERLGEALETGGAGRITIWSNGLRALENYWLIGAGLNNFAEAYREVAHFTPFSSGIGRASHNIYLNIFVELGIAGFALMLWGIIKHHQAIRSKIINPGSHKIMLRAALCGMLVASFFLDTFWYKSFWVLWMMIVMYSRTARMRTGYATGACAHRQD